MKTATIFNIQRFSLHDGPGIRTTVFLKGCPLRCAWCHNPESLDSRPEPILASHHCVACDSCVPVCPEHLTGRIDTNGSSHHPGEACVRCGECAEACPSGAREMAGEEWSANALVDELLRDRVYHDESGGGITFSGGEPLTAGNAAFVIECLESLAAHGIHTAVDTCGHVPTRVLLDAAQRAHLFLYDLKLLDAERHALATGQDNTLILDNLTALLQTDCEVWVRVPLIPGQTDDDENLVTLAGFLRQQATIPRVHLLPYHSTGVNKYTRLGRSTELAEATTVSEAEAEAKAQLLRDHGLRVHVGG